MHKYCGILFFSFIFCAGLQAQARHENPADSSYLNGGEAVLQNGQDYSVKRVDTFLFFNHMKVSPDTIQRWKGMNGFEYAGYLDSLLSERQNRNIAKRDEHTTSEPGWLNRLLSAEGTRVFFWTLAVAFILFILYRLFLTEGFFKRKPTGWQTTVAATTGALFNNEQDFDNHISHSICNGNYRLAVRYQYLKILYKLATGNFITMAAEKTNFQYVREISQHNLQNDFSSLTLSYEYVWYGEFEIDEKMYSRLLPGFSGFNQKIQTGY